MEKQNLSRLHGLDIFRGLAIIFMILYHFTYDLTLYNMVQLDMNHAPYLLAIRYTIMSMFLLSVGMSLTLAHQKTIYWHKIAKRSLLLALSSFAITISTYIVFPNSWIYFGMLHFILISSILVLPLLKFPKTTLLFTLLILIGSFTGLLHMHHLFALLQEPLSLPSPMSQDVVRLFPWLAVVLIGIVVVQHKWHEKLFKHQLFNMKYSINKVLKKIGRHSLLIYLIHQPIIFLGFDLYVKFSSKQ
ncbi:MAG: Unknown protein [uncultured Sulfurovum sp.]|uniref:Heparan-alpha-glucosaminide N-acetyltransferase catalytic domain-containing protein n=1 Tax=uncultured Sulfurovum sp. TaxID=269237 RepID=A0A6S6TZY3_9BACT|nr:MAG: Unknown protein [uncultured Sulfurovum sp.]